MKHRSGFTLLEILIALAILVVGVAAIVNVFPVGLRATKRAADFTSIGILAQEKMAEAMYLGYDGLTEIKGINTASGIYSFPSEDDKYSYRIFYDAVTGIANLREVTLAIYWNDRGVQRDEMFTTYIAKRD